MMNRALLLVLVFAATLMHNTHNGGVDAANCTGSQTKYAECFASNCTTCNITLSLPMGNTSTADDVCQSNVDAACQVTKCCGACTTEINKYFNCLFDLDVPGKNCVRDCDKMTGTVKEENKSGAASVSIGSMSFIATIGLMSMMVSQFVM